MKRLVKDIRVGLGLALAVIIATVVGAMPATANPTGTGLVVSQVYGGGGNTGATFTNDFIEIFNPTSAPVNVNGWSVQYASATGTGNFTATPLPNVTLAPGQYLLVQEAAGAGGTTPLPTPDAIGSIAMSGTAGKVILANVATGLACNGSVGQPCSAGQLAQIVDLVGYGTANFFEGTAAAPTLSNTTAALRAANGCTDTDENDDDFASSAPTPRNTASPVNPCVVGPPDLVLNEIDYDQPSTDTAEFIEIRNNGSSAVSLDGVSVVRINGTGGGAAQYGTTALPNVTLAAGDYYVVCANAANTANCDLDITPDTDLIQNGAPDAVGLYHSTTLLDAVSYEGDTGAPFTEGSGTGLVDTAVGTLESISRCPDGADTNVNNVDFQLRPGTPGAANNCPAADAAPEVTTTVPANGAVDVAVDASVSVTFSEAVNVAGAWFTISCASSGPHAATASGGPTTFTLDPSVDFALNEVCTVTVDAANVTDQDGIDPPDNMAANYVFSFTTTAGPPCLQPFTPIYTIQGSGLATPIPGNLSTQGVVVGDYEGSTGLGGFYMQDLFGDGDAATSDGIFVFTGTANLVSAGDVVRVTGFARERFNQTAINGTNDNNSAVTNIVNCGSGSVAATDVTMPFAALTYPERFEGMLVRFPQALVISEYFNYERFGELVLAQPWLSGETRPFTGTAIDEPGAPANARTAANALRRITLDDGLSTQNPSVLRHPNGAAFALDNAFRGGDTVANAVGVLGFDFSLYRIQPTGPADYASVNPRPAAPEPVGGSVRVAAMNTLNYFVTLDPLDDTTPDNPADNICGPTGTPHDCRGADLSQPDEFPRQRAKLLAALAGIDADVLGLNELENTTGVEPLADIVAGLPGYAYVDTGTIGTDAIKVGLIYKTATVAPVGAFQILDSSDDPRFIDTRSRPVLAQTFEVLATGARFTVAVNHLKSKGSACLGAPLNDPDAGDGQGNCNLTRTAAAQALVDWLATDPTGSGDGDFLIVGDLNSYAKEDPIDAIKAGADDSPGTSDDYTNLVEAYLGTYAYSYVFDGQSGYLDHALSSSQLSSQVTGVAEWHINADEPDVFDYDTSFKPPAQEALYEPNGFRSSDHDPIIVGLDALPTFDDLCRLTRSLVTKPGVADALCDKLEAAEAADAAGDENAKAGALKAYRNQLSAQAGKSVSHADAELLAAASMLL